MNRVQGVQHAFTVLMDSDTDMVLMNLARYRADPSLFAPGLEQEQDHEDVELLLESYLQHSKSIMLVCLFVCFSLWEVVCLSVFLCRCVVGVVTQRVMLGCVSVSVSLL